MLLVERVDRALRVNPQFAVQRILRHLQPEQRAAVWRREEFDRFFFPSNSGELHRWRVEIIEWTLSAPGIHSFYNRLDDDDGNGDAQEWEIRALIRIDRKSFRYLDLDVQVVADDSREMESGEIGFITLAAYPLVGFMRFHDEDLYPGQYWPAAKLVVTASAWRDVFANLRIEVLRGNRKPRIDLVGSPFRMDSTPVVNRRTWDEFVSVARARLESLAREATNTNGKADRLPSNIAIEDFRLSASRAIVRSKFTRPRLSMFQFPWDRVLSD